VRVAVLGAGAVGARAARQVASTEGVTRVLVTDRRAERVRTVVQSLGDVAVPLPADDSEWAAACDVAILALPPGGHDAVARSFLDRGVPVVSVSDAIADVEALLDLDTVARERNLPLVIGAAFAPGLSCLLACHAAAGFDAVEEVHVGKVGTGGPACARQHHAALGQRALDWRDGGWLERRSGSGRELSWFPDPVGARDCYRAGLPDALLLTPAFPGVERVTARFAATRRDRVTARFPMLRRPHPEGGPGAIRVEVRGTKGGSRAVTVLGAIDRPAVAAGAVAALAATFAAEGRLRRSGAGGLAELGEPLAMLTELARRGVKAAIFDGAPA
jgi:saccharopine dehydrogenase-like NADP-dependent oxidoreductase